MVRSDPQVGQIYEGDFSPGGATHHYRCTCKYIVLDLYSKDELRSGFSFSGCVMISLQAHAVLDLRCDLEFD